MPAASRQLDQVRATLDDARRRFDALTAAVTDAAWNRRPRADRWSVAECIAHLNLSAAAMLPLIDRALADARAHPPVGERAYRPTLLGRVLAATMGPTPRLGGFVIGAVRTPPPFVPGSELPRAQVTAEFLRWQAEDERVVHAAAGLAMDRVRIESPFRAGAFYDGWSALVIVARHKLRHLVQAERALAALERR